jgi:uncharacterized membrane protein
MLSDGVFAIAITLLAFDIRGPAAWDGRLAGLWAELAPQLDAFALSAVVISVYWLAHRRFMAMVHSIDAVATVLTLIMLSLVTLLPAATRLVHEYSQPGVMVVYGALVVAIGVSMAALWGYLALITDCVFAEMPRRVRWFWFALMMISPPLFLALITALPGHGPGVVPLVLMILFVVGWRLRLRVQGWLEGGADPPSEGD